MPFKKKPALRFKPRQMNPQGILDYDEDKYLRNVNPALNEQIHRIESSIKKEARRGLMSHYAIGRLVKEIEDDDPLNGGKQHYGEDAMKKLHHALSWCSSSLYDALHVVKVYTEDEVKRISQTQTVSGRFISWTYLRELAQVPDKAERDDLLHRVIEEDWTPDTLRRELRKIYGKANNRGGQLKAPKSFDEAIDQQAAIAEKFLERAEKVWKDQDHSLTHYFLELPRKQHTEEKAQKLKEHAEKLRRLAQEAEEQAREAEEVYERFLKLMETSKASDDSQAEVADETAESEPSDVDEQEELGEEAPLEVEKDDRVLCTAGEPALAA
jgi:methyl-accepting chemotaxis protein